MGCRSATAKRHPGLDDDERTGVADDFYARIVNILNQHEAQAILDTSGKSLQLGCAEKPYLVKPSVEEARALTSLPMDTPAEIALAAAKICEMGAQNIIVSMRPAAGSSWMRFRSMPWNAN